MTQYVIDEVESFAKSWYIATQGMDSQKYVAFDRNGSTPISVINPHMVVQRKIPEGTVELIKTLYIVRHEICQKAKHTTNGVVLGKLYSRFIANELLLLKAWGMEPLLSNVQYELFPKMNAIKK